MLGLLAEVDDTERENKVADLAETVKVRLQVCALTSLC